MAIEYFGYTTITNSVESYTDNAYDISNSYVFTSPGATNDQYRVVSLEMYTRSTVSSTLRMALYDTSLNLIGQGASAVTLSSTAGWQGHTTTASIKPIDGSAGQPVYIIGGTNYKIALARTNSIYFYSQTLAFGTGWRFVAQTTPNYATNEFPNTITIPSNNDYCSTNSWAVRVGVELQDSTGHPANKRLGGIPFSSQSIQSQYRW